MVVKFFANKKGGSSKAIDYLLNEREQKGTARVLQGDPDLTKQIINDIKFKQKTTVGCLSFEEKNISEDMKFQLMKDFENMLLPSMENRYNILWVEHTDKDRLELNFVIPKIDLESQKSLNPYYHKADLPRVEMWQDIQNLEHNFTNPKDPSKARTLQTNTKEVGLSKDYEQLAKLLHNLTEQGQINNREQLIELLQSNQIEVTRKGSDYLAIKLPDSKKAKRFKGGIYDEKFTSITGLKELSQTAEQRVKQYNSRDTQAELREIKSRLADYTRDKEQKYRELYPAVGSKSREIEREFNRDTREETAKYRVDNKEQIRKREQSKSHIDGNSNIHSNNRHDIDNSLLYDKQTVSGKRANDILFLHDKTQQGAVNDSTRTTINARIGTRESTVYRAYSEARQTRNEFLINITDNRERLQDLFRAEQERIREHTSRTRQLIQPIREFARRVTNTIKSTREIIKAKFNRANHSKRDYGMQR